MMYMCFLRLVGAFPFLSKVQLWKTKITLAGDPMGRLLPYFCKKWCFVEAFFLGCCFGLSGTTVPTDLLGR